MPEITPLLACFTSDPDGNRPVLEKPFTVDVDGQPYTVATNGWRLIAIPGDQGFRPEPEAAPMVESMGKQIAGWLTADRPTSEPADVPLGNLRAWIGTSVPATCSVCNGRFTWKCEECGGTGEVECECPECDHVHERACEHCDGDGKVACEACTATHGYDIEPVKLGDMIFNAPNLRAALRYLTGERVTVQLAPLGKPTWIIAENGTVFLMPVRGTAGRKDVPEFPLRTEAASIAE